jgi:hypothetical protein
MLNGLRAVAPCWWPQMCARPCFQASLAPNPEFAALRYLQVSQTLARFGPMPNVFAMFMRRAASTCFVLFALFIACGAVQATPCDAPLEHAVHATLAVDDAAAGDDFDPAPSIEDNTVSLDDTFDVPPQHVVPLGRTLAAHLPAPPPPPHAHHHSFELRPPIAA